MKHNIGWKYETFIHIALNCTYLRRNFYSYCVKLYISQEILLKLISHAICFNFSVPIPKSYIYSVNNNFPLIIWSNVLFIPFTFIKRKGKLNICISIGIYSTDIDPTRHVWKHRASILKINNSLFLARYYIFFKNMFKIFRKFFIQDNQ